MHIETTSRMFQTLRQKFAPGLERPNLADDVDGIEVQAEQQQHKGDDDLVKPDSLAAPDTTAQDGVTAAEAITLTWTKTSLGAAYIL